MRAERPAFTAARSGVRRKPQLLRDISRLFVESGAFGCIRPTLEFDAVATGIAQGRDPHSVAHEGQGRFESSRGGLTVNRQSVGTEEHDRYPEALRQFAFLLGKWRGVAKLKQEDGAWESLNASWEGRYILDGYAIADEYRMTTPEGQLLVLGINLRSYDAEKKAWNMKWLNALSGTWTDLGQEELGGVVADGTAISYCMKEPVARHAITRATYDRISADRFTWRGDRSNDGKTWKQFLLIELRREA